uniref:Shisa N-terminal domain-containing protein n=1 Tax=Oreochromis aureus TaxID=47969 RepID=A0A668S8I7_OREAU
MGIRYLLLLLIYLDPLSVLSAATGGKKSKQATRKAPKATAIPTVVPQKTPKPSPVRKHESCKGYFDVSGQFDSAFECNNTDHRYCCGTCFLRFCCEYKKDRLDQTACTNYVTPGWLETATPSPSPTGDPYPYMDQTNTAVYITCGIIAFIIVLGVSAKVAYDKATEPPQEMNIHRALADILRQQGPIPISQYDCENFAAMNGSPKDNTPVRTSSKNHYTPVHTSKSNHGTHQHNYNHVALGSPTRTPKNENNRISGILTSQTEPYDLSFSRSFQSLSHLPPSYEAAVKADLNRFSSLKKLTDKEVEDYYTRKRHLPDLAARSTLPLHVLKMSQEQRLLPQDRHTSQDRLYSKDRMYSKDRLLSQEHLYSKDRHYSQDRLYSQERLYSQDRLLSQDPLLSPDKLMSDKSMSRAISHTDVFIPTTPLMDRYKMTKMHSHPSASNNSGAMNQTANKRQAFASRRTHTVEQLHYIPQHHQQQQQQPQHYRTGSKTEVTV